uniref:Uncharacterized protein n=1 Tax=Moschus moschiferus TaxID=68415 RepID=A0A8C6DTC7_MOSMO
SQMNPIHHGRWQGGCRLLLDFLGVVTAALISLALSPPRLSRRPWRWVFLAIMLFALDFNLIFCNMAEFLKPGGAAEMTTADKAEVENSDGDSGGGPGTVC